MNRSLLIGGWVCWGFALIGFGGLIYLSILSYPFKHVTTDPNEPAIQHGMKLVMEEEYVRQEIIEDISFMAMVCGGLLAVAMFLLWRRQCSAGIKEQVEDKSLDEK